MLKQKLPTVKPDAPISMSTFAARLHEPLFSSNCHIFVAGPPLWPHPLHVLPFQVGVFVIV